MDRYRKESDSEQEHFDEVAPAPAPRPSPVAQLQRGIGNAALLQMRAQRAVQNRDIFDEAREDQAARRAATEQAMAEQAVVAIPSGGEPLPAAVQARAEAQHGVSMADVKVVHNADAATDPLGAKAFTTQDGDTPKVVMGTADMTSQDAQFTLMHELTHVAQQKKGMTGGLEGLGGDAATREHLEQHADEHAAEMLKDPAHKH